MSSCDATIKSNAPVLQACRTAVRMASLRVANRERGSAESMPTIALALDG
jgi:hypothetical protein